MSKSLMVKFLFTLEYPNRMKLNPELKFGSKQRVMGSCDESYIYFQTILLSDFHIPLIYYPQNCLHCVWQTVDRLLTSIVSFWMDRLQSVICSDKLLECDAGLEHRLGILDRKQGPSYNIHANAVNQGN